MEVLKYNLKTEFTVLVPDRVREQNDNFLDIIALMVVAPCPKTQNKRRDTEEGKEDTKLQFGYVGF